MATRRFSHEVLEFLRTKARSNPDGSPWSLRDFCNAWAAVVTDGRQMSRQQIRQYERAQVVPGANIVAGIADVYGVPTDALFTFSPTRLSEDDVRQHLAAFGEAA